MAEKSRHSKAAAIVSSDEILPGVFFALRQAWELLSAANILQEAGKFSTAYGLAVFCREEIGKSKFLEKHWKASMAGKLVSTQDLNSGDLTSHPRKLRAVGKVLSEGVLSQGAHKSLHHIREINVKARELDPDRTHLGRQRAFYVEIHEAGAGWRKPWTAFDSTRSRGEILETESAYLLRRCELEVLKQKVGRTDVVVLPTNLDSQGLRI
jgi:AbiV family abortive infection protein